MTAQPDTAPDTQVKVSAYILDAGGGLPFHRNLTWSFYQADTGRDPWREQDLAGPLAPEYHDETRDALAAWAEVSGVTFTQVADGADVHLRIGLLTPEAGQGHGGLGGGLLSETLRSFAGLSPHIFPAHDDAAIYNILLHEIGHALLIDHSDVPGAVMSGSPHTPYTHAPHGVREELQPDDIAAVQAVWGPPASVPPDLTEPGRLFEPTYPVAWRGTAGDDTFSPTVYGALDDLFAGGFGADYIEGGNGNDTLMGNGLYWTSWDNPAHDHWSRTYDGLDDGDTIFGDGRIVDELLSRFTGIDIEADDFINGNAGLDYLDGGPGDDTIYGGQNAGAWTPGKTRAGTIHLREGHDTLKGGPGDDWMNGNMGTDLLYGGPGNDWMRGGQDEDLLEGEEGDDSIWGDLEGDTLDGGPGADHIILGNDTGAGDGHVDHVRFTGGEAEGDVVYGLEDHDVLWIDGAIATRDQVAALGVTFVPLAQA